MRGQGLERPMDLSNMFRTKCLRTKGLRSKGGGASIGWRVSRSKTTQKLSKIGPRVIVCIEVRGIMSRDEVS